MSKKRRLDPCPFCGNAELTVGPIHDEGGSWMRVVCLECKTEGPHAPMPQGYPIPAPVVAKVQRKAERLWNARME